MYRGMDRVMLLKPGDYPQGPKGESQLRMTASSKEAQHALVARVLPAWIVTLL